MTDPQKSLLSAIPDIISLIDKRPSDEDRKRLIRLLRRRPNVGSVWDEAIRRVFNNPRKDQRKEQIETLIEQLSNQAADNCFTMSKIVGWDATILLLRICHDHLKTEVEFYYSLPVKKIEINGKKTKKKTSV